LRGKNAKKYFTNDGKLKRIPTLHYWPLKNVLVEKYKIKEQESEMFASFIEPML